jgi:hypothetical protein
MHSLATGAHQTVHTLQLDISDNELNALVWSRLSESLVDWSALKRCDIDVSGNICGMPMHNILSHLDLRVRSVGPNNFRLPTCAPIDADDDDPSTVWM